MTSYTKRDLRAVDMLAMVLVGFGAFLLLWAVLSLTFTKSTAHTMPSPRVWIIAGVFVLLGVALNLKVKELVRNGGREPEDYPGVRE